MWSVVIVNTPKYILSCDLKYFHPIAETKKASAIDQANIVLSSTY